jgi:hypothetical protein
MSLAAAACFLDASGLLSVEESHPRNTVELKVEVEVLLEAEVFISQNETLD